MFEQLAIEQTPVAVQIYTQNYFEGPKTPSPQKDRRASAVQSTSPTTLETPIVDRKVTSTATIADISDRRHTRSVHAQAIDKPITESFIDKTVDDRVTLLAQKYAGKIDSEGSARLEILTARLNQLVPPIEDSTVDRVGEVVAAARRSKSRVSALKAKYG